MDLKLFVMICLLRAARCSAGDGPCPCPQIPPGPEHALPPPSRCFAIGTRIRYNCTEGFVREAGTSSLTVCEVKDGGASWRKASLKCKPDPNRPTTPPQPNPSPEDGVVSSSTDTPSSSLPMTQSIYVPTSVTLHRVSREPTSPGQQVLPDVTTALDGTAPPSAAPPSAAPPSAAPPSAAPEPSYKPTVHARVSNLSSSTTAGLAAAASLVIVCAVVGLSCFFYRRRTGSHAPPHTAEEVIKMNDT